MEDNVHFNKTVRADMEYMAAGVGNPELFENRKILITGGAGFLGYYFLNYFAFLLSQGAGPAEIIVLDNFMLDRPSWLQDLSHNFQAINVHEFDVATTQISTVPGADSADYVIHMASIASPTFYRRYPIKTLDANVWGLRNLLDFYKERPIKGLLFFSSSEIYGDPYPEFVPTTEDYRGNVSCLGPRACYDEAKRFGETMCYLFSEQHEMPITIVRPFNNYGPGMSLNDRRVPADFAQAVMNGENIVILSNGSPTRTFCYVADAVMGYLKALLTGGFGYFNIGIDRPEITIMELARIYQSAARDLFDYKGTIVYSTSDDGNYLTDNPLRRSPDISKARTVLGFNPTILVDEGVRRFLEFLQEERSK